VLVIYINLSYQFIPLSLAQNEKLHSIEDLGEAIDLQQ